MTNITYRTAGGEIVRSFSYAYDLSGMITNKQTAGESVQSSVAYTYDGLGRLTSETLTPSTSSNASTPRSYTYDLAGNRLTSVQDGVTNTYAYGIGNRFSSVSDGTSYTHDTAGNVSQIVRSGVTRDLVWNLQGQLLSVSTNSAFAESYQYDPLGRRISTTTNPAGAPNPTTVYHVYDGAQCIADIDSSGNPLASYTWGQGIDNLLAVTTYGAFQTNTFFAVKDHLGSVQALVDEDGNTVLTVNYDAWGTPLNYPLSILNSSSAISFRAASTAMRPGCITSVPNGMIRRPAAG